MIVIIIALMCMGLLALKKLKVNQIPDVEEPALVVSIPYPGASPETVEREIINRLEKSPAEEKGYQQYRELYGIFALWATLLLVLDLICRWVLLKKIP